MKYICCTLLIMFVYGRNMFTVQNASKSVVLCFVNWLCAEDIISKQPVKFTSLYILSTVVCLILFHARLGVYLVYSYVCPTLSGTDIGLWYSTNLFTVMAPEETTDSNTTETTQTYQHPNQINDFIRHDSYYIIRGVAQLSYLLTYLLIVFSVRRLELYIHMYNKVWKQNNLFLYHERIEFSCDRYYWLAVRVTVEYI